MTRRINFELTEEQRGALEGAINSDERAEGRQRAIAVRLLGLGYHPEQVAAMVMNKANTVYGWHRRHRIEGLEGLADKPRSGRPRKGTPAYCQILTETLETDPSTLRVSIHGLDGRTLARPSGTDHRDSVEHRTLCNPARTRRLCLSPTQSGFDPQAEPKCETTNCRVAR